MNYTREDKQAIATIKDACVSTLVDGIQWYDTEWLLNCSSVQWEVKYLRTRGLLIHHPLIQKLVRLQGVQRGQQPIQLRKDRFIHRIGEKDDTWEHLDCPPLKDDSVRER